MSTSPQGSDSYIRRNLPPLIVGLAAIVAIVGGLIVLIDRANDDDDTRASAVDVPIESDRFEDRLEGEFAELLQELVGDRLLLGVSLSEELGVLVVERIVAGTPADEAGIEVGDEILEVEGEPVSTVEELRDAIAAIDIGDEYEIEVGRGGDSELLAVQREITIGAAMAALLERFADEGFDLDRFDLDDFDSRAPNRRFGFDREDPFEAFRLRPTLGLAVVQTNEGLRVVRVDDGSIAEEAGFEAGDVILEADGDSIETIDDLRDALPMPTLTLDDPPSSIVEVVDILVLREGDEILLEARFEIDAFGPFFAPREGPELPNATPEPDRFAEQLLDELRELESFLESDEFFDRLDDQLSNRLEALIEEALAASLAEQDATAAADDAEQPVSLGDLDVYRGTVDLYTDAQIVLGGSLGSIAFDLTDDTVVVGRQPRVGGISTVASNVDREALLILTVN